MHRLNFPAGSTIRLDAAARPDIGVHRWEVRMLAATAPDTGSPPRQTYGSQIGERDCEQRLDIGSEMIVGTGGCPVAANPS